MTTRRLPTEEEVLGYFQALSNWGRWGDDDQLGTLNLITPEKRQQAAALVKDGISIGCARPASTAYALDQPVMPVHFMVDSGEVYCLDDEQRADGPKPGRLFRHGHLRPRPAPLMCLVDCPASDEVDCCMEVNILCLRRKSLSIEPCEPFSREGYQPTRHTQNSQASLRKQHKGPLITWKALLN